MWAILFGFKIWCHKWMKFVPLQVKIQGQNQEMLFAACQQFLGKSLAEIRSVALETLVRFVHPFVKASWSDHNNI